MKSTIPDINQIHACCTLDPRLFRVPPDIPVKEAISLNGKLWAPGDTIRLGFLDGTATQRSKAQRWIEYWLQVVNLHFDFSGGAQPHIRITFAPGGSWSYIGTDCRNIPSGPTMQFGWVTDTSDDTSDRAVIVHEMGHALGAGHEQSNPQQDIQWDRAKALNYYMVTQGWTAEMVQSNVFDVYRPDQVTGTSYDRTSIMQYPVPAELTLDGRGIAWTTDLSSLDHQYWSSVYPSAATPPPTPPTPPPAPPARPPSAPGEVILDEPAISLPVVAGQPALFHLTVPQPGPLLVYLATIVNPGYGRWPVVTMRHGAGKPTVLALTRGEGTFYLPAARYDVAVYGPLPKQGGTAWLRARSL